MRWRRVPKQSCPTREAKKIQIKLATTCNKNEQQQQQNDKKNAELWTEWAKKTWKAVEENIRRGRDRSIGWRMTMTNVLSAPLYVVSKRWQRPETEGGACETLRTPLSGATADRNMSAGLYVQNMPSNSGKNTAWQTRSVAGWGCGGGIFVMQRE